MRIVASSSLLCAVLLFLPRFSSQATLGSRPKPGPGDDGEAAVEVDTTEPLPRVPAEEEVAAESEGDVEPELPTAESPSSGDVPNQRQTPPADDDQPGGGGKPVVDEPDLVSVGNPVGEEERRHVLPNQRQTPAPADDETIEARAASDDEYQVGEEDEYRHQRVHGDRYLSEMDLSLERLHGHDRLRRSVDGAMRHSDDYWHDVIGPNEELAKHNVGYRIKNYIRKRLETTDPGYRYGDGGWPYFNVPPPRGPGWDWPVYAAGPPPFRHGYV